MRRVSTPRGIRAIPACPKLRCKFSYLFFEAFLLRRIKELILYPYLLQKRCRLHIEQRQERFSLTVIWELLKHLADKSLVPPLTIFGCPKRENRSETFPAKAASGKLFFNRFE